MFNIDFGSKRSKSAIRFATYAISGVFVVGLTIALVLATLGYDIDRSTGQVIQNGLVLVNSEPESALVTIDGQDERDNTPGRFSLPTGEHQIKINREGYREWSKTVSVGGAEVVWLYYPILFPSEIKAQAITTAKNLEFVSPLPDGQRMLIREKSQNTDFRIERINKTSVTDAEKINVPKRLLSKQSGNIGTLTFKGWASGDDYFLLHHKVGNTVEFILVNFNEPDKSMNLSQTFALPLREVRFIKDDHNQLYALVDGDLRYLNVNDKTISSPIIEGVKFFSLYEDRFVAFIRSNGGNVDVGLIDGRENEPTIIRSVRGEAKDHLVEFAKYDNVFYLAHLNKNNGQTNIYKNPQSDQDPEVKGIRNSGANFLSFSRNGRFVMTQADNRFKLYDIEYEDELSFATDINIDESEQVEWMDGHHLVLVNKAGAVYVTEFDGENTTRIGRADPDVGVLYNPGQQMIYYFAQPTENNVSILRGIDLIVN